MCCWHTCLIEALDKCLRVSHRRGVDYTGKTLAEPNIFLHSICNKPRPVHFFSGLLLINVFPGNVKSRYIRLLTRVDFGWD